MFAQRSRHNIIASQFYLLIKQTLPITLKALILLTQNVPNFHERLQKPNLSAIVIECLRFAVVCAEQSEFYNIF